MSKSRKRKPTKLQLRKQAAAQLEGNKQLLRDELVDGLRRDIDQLIGMLQGTINTLNRTNDRLSFYEAQIPALGKARKSYDKRLRAAVRKLEVSNQKKAAEFIQSPPREFKP